MNNLMIFFRDFHPLFVLFYITLLVSSVYIFKIYFMENENPNFFLSLLCIASIGIVIWKFPTRLGEGMMAFAGYLALVCTPASFLVIIVSKLIAENLVGARDFMKTGKRDPVEEMQERVENLLISAKYDEAVMYIREKIKKHPKDYRLNQELANIALGNLKDYPMALAEFKEVLRKTDKEEPVTFSLYRMVDIYLSYLDEKEKGRECLNLIIKQFPNSDFAKNARMRLEAMDAQAGAEPEPQHFTKSGGWRRSTLVPEDESDSELARYLSGGDPAPLKNPSSAKSDWRRGMHNITQGDRPPEIPSEGSRPTQKIPDSWDRPPGQSESGRPTQKIPDSWDKPPAPPKREPEKGRNTGGISNLWKKPAAPDDDF